MAHHTHKGLQKNLADLYMATSRRHVQRCCPCHAGGPGPGLLLGQVLDCAYIDAGPVLQQHLHRAAVTSPYSHVEGRQACHVAHVHAVTGASGRAADARAGLRVRPHDPHALHQCKWCCGGSAELLCVVQVFDIKVQACDRKVQQLAGASPASQRAQRLCDACCYVMNAACNTCKPLLAWSACSKLKALLAQTPTASPSLPAPVLGTARAVALMQPLPPATAPACTPLYLLGA